MTVKCHKPLRKGWGHYFMWGSFPSVFYNSVLFSIWLPTKRNSARGTANRIAKGLLHIRNDPIASWVSSFTIFNYILFLKLLTRWKNCYPFGVCKVALQGPMTGTEGRSDILWPLEENTAGFPVKIPIVPYSPSSRASEAISSSKNQ